MLAGLLVLLSSMTPFLNDTNTQARRAGEGKSKCGNARMGARHSRLNVGGQWDNFGFCYVSDKLDVADRKSVV